MARTAESMHRAATELSNRGRLVAAQRMLARARDSTEDPNLQARIAATLAVTLARTGHLDEAERVCMSAMESPGLSRETRAIVEAQMGTVAEWAGHLDDANTWLTKAIATIQDPIPRAHALINRGSIGMQRRDLDAAAADTAAAAAIYSERALPIDEAEARHNLGYIDLLRGNLVAALSSMSAARPTLGSSKASGAISDLDRAEVLREAGLTREAESLLEKAAFAFGQTRMPKERAEAEFHLARSLLTHDPVTARKVAASAVRRFRNIGSQSWATRAEAVRLRAELSGGQVLEGGTKAPKASRPPHSTEVEETAISLEGRGFRSEAAALRLAYDLSRARQGDVTDSGRRVRLPRTAPIEVEILSHEVRAVRAGARGRHSDARRHAARGLDVLSGWQQTFGSLDLQTSVAMHGGGLIGTGLHSAVRSGRPDVVFEWSERARHLSLQVVPLRPPPDDELADDLAELRMLRAGDDRWRSNPRAAELEAHARQHQWSATGFGTVHERASLEEAQSALDAETAIVAFVFSGDALGVVVVTIDSSRFIPIEGWSEVRKLLPGLRADLDMAASVGAGPLAAAVQRSLDERLATLSRILLDDALRSVDARRLILTAPGVLNGMPWPMLPGMRGRVHTLASSVSRWLRLRHDARDSRPTAGFAIGPRVPRAAEEVHVAAAAWTNPLVMSKATIADVAALSARVDVLHIAAHGRHAVDNPLFSGLELADGTLFGYDIDLMPQVPDTVVLSACEVGRSSVRWGEEAIGMTRIWLHAGTRCVIAAPVVVADDVACELLGEMHQGLAAGLAPAVALAEASERTGIVAPFQAHGSGF